MVALRGTYHNGQLKLEKDVTTDTPVDVIVTFLEVEVNSEKKPLRWEDFNFDKSREALKDVKGSISDALIEERRSER